MEAYSPLCLEAKSSFGRATLPPKALGEAPCLPSSFSGCSWLVSLSLQSLLLPSYRLHLFLPVPSVLFLIRTLVIGFRAHLDNSKRSDL